MHQVFLSYARADEKAAERLYKDLGSLPGISVWMDKFDLLPGMQWEPAIFKAIREARLFIALLSTTGTSKAGFRHTEIRRALEIVNEFPDSSIYLIPTRLDDCQPPIESLTKYTYANLFPKWKTGVSRLQDSIRKVVGAPAGTVSKSKAPTSKSKAPTTSRAVAKAKSLPPRGGAGHYRVALLDLAAQLKELPDIARSLSRVQSLFEFHAIKGQPTRAALTRREGRPQLDLDRLSGKFYDQFAPLSDDRIICHTNRFLLFERDGYEYFNYLGHESPVNRRVTFVSVYDLQKEAAEAGVSVPVAIAYSVVSDLSAFFLKTGYHRQTRSCPLDFTEIHADSVLGLRAGRFCSDCEKSLKQNSTLHVAMKALLRWGRAK